MAGKITSKKTNSKKEPVIETHKCGCDKSCSCGCKKHCGFWKKLIVVLVFFALGFATAKMIPTQKRAPKPRSQFDEKGCFIVRTPKMAERIAMMDANKDGCVEKTEYSEYRRKNRQTQQKKPVAK